ncbi:MAG: amine oxidase [Bradymonadales bacterium]|nr:MAG: amine oxidase [Bradymonadales bacterium]
MSEKTVILGAGPCGLGAGYRLKDLGLSNFEIYEAESYPGGLATSFVDAEGFTWDIGGHVQFSHYEEFDRVMNEALGDEWLTHERESWVWIFDRFTPYPFQKNLWRLPKTVQEDCIAGLEKLQEKKTLPPTNFKEWILQSFGEGISEVFMLPYNFKVWAYPPEMMDYRWIGERVATIDLPELKKKTAQQQDDVSWGPNAVFRFPKKGGTGAIWKRVAELVGLEKIRFSKRVVRIDPDQRRLFFQDGTESAYDSLLSTLAIDDLCRLAKIPMSGELLSSSSHIIGIGLEGKTPEALQTKCWMYFPESHSPFYRVTVFSNYSPFNVPDSTRHWSLMCEVSESSFKPVQKETLIEDCIAGLRATRLISERDRIVSRWQYCARKGYPTPSLGRDQILAVANSKLAAKGIYSRGRFGQWRYEVSNQDHTFMQGWEWADWRHTGKKEKTIFG